MRLIGRIVLVPAAIVACGLVTGCFSYERTVDTTPVPVIETAPPVVEVTPAPLVVSPATTKSTTTTTTDSDGVVQQQRLSTYTTPY